MTKETLIGALKNRDLRSNVQGKINHPSGNTIEDLNEWELKEIQGAYDVQPDTTPLCFIVSATIGGAGGLGFSILYCN